MNPDKGINPVTSHFESTARWASVSAPTLIVDVEIDDHPVHNDKERVHQRSEESSMLPA